MTYIRDRITKPEHMPRASHGTCVNVEYCGHRDTDLGDDHCSECWDRGSDTDSIHIRERKKQRKGGEKKKRKRKRKSKTRSYARARKDSKSRHTSGAIMAPSA